MKRAFVFRITAEICFFFSVVTGFDSFYHNALASSDAFLPLWLPMALFAAVSFALGFLIIRFEKPLVRFLLALLPGLCLLAAGLQPLMLIPALAWLYYILVMTQGHYAFPLEEYRKIFTFLLVISLFFLAANIANSTIYSGKTLSPLSLVFTFLFLAFGVIAMRMMQMGADMGTRWHLSNAISVLGIPLLAVGVSLLLFLLLRYSNAALKHVLTPIGMFFLWLFHKLFPDGTPIDEMSLKDALKPHSIVHSVEDPNDGMGRSVSGDVFSEAAHRLLIDKAASIGAYVVLAILLLLTLYLILQYVRRSKPLYAEDESYYDESEQIVSDKKKSKDKEAPLVGNAKQLRRVYRTYLEFVHGRGLTIHAADTSREVLDRSRSIIDGPQAERLRELYLAARYGDPKTITREQVKEAQACLEQILADAKKEG